MLISILLFVGAYIVGSIPTGYWVSKYCFGVDITTHGSGNIGATNVARTLGKQYFVPIFLIDAIKAYGVLLSSSLAKVHNTEILYLMAIALLIGNAHSIFMNFKGGKGVATMLGLVTFFASWHLTALFMVTWLGILAITKKAFIASLCSAALMTGIALLGNFGNHGIFFLIMTCWLMWRHRSNVTKLRA